MKFVEPIRKIEDIDNMKEYLKYKSKRNYIMFIIGINTALRIDDLLSLKVKDIYYKKFLEIKEKKTGKRRKAYLFPEVQREVNDYIDEFELEQENYLIKSNKGFNKPISRKQAYKIIRDAAEACLLKNIGTHSMRKTFGYHFYQKTKDIAELMKQLNHSSELVTQRYIGIADDDNMRAMKRFGGL